MTLNDKGRIPERLSICVGERVTQLSGDECVRHEEQQKAGVEQAGWSMMGDEVRQVRVGEFCRTSLVEH